MPVYTYETNHRPEPHQRLALITKDCQKRNVTPATMTNVECEGLRDQALQLMVDIHNKWERADQTQGYNDRVRQLVEMIRKRIPHANTMHQWNVLTEGYNITQACITAAERQTERLGLSN